MVLRGSDIGVGRRARALAPAVVIAALAVIALLGSGGAPAHAGTGCFVPNLAVNIDNQAGQLQLTEQAISNAQWVQPPPPLIHGNSQASFCAESNATPGKAGANYVLTRSPTGPVDFFLQGGGYPLGYCQDSLQLEVACTVTFANGQLAIQAVVSHAFASAVVRAFPGQTRAAVAAAGLQTYATSRTAARLQATVRTGAAASGFVVGRLSTPIRAGEDRLLSVPLTAAGRRRVRAGATTTLVARLVDGRGRVIRRFTHRVRLGATAGGGFTG